MATLGEAFIEVHADTKPFAREIAPQLKTILDAVGTKGKTQATRAGKKIGDGLDEGIGSRFPLLRRRFSGLANMIDDLRDRIDKQGGLRQSFERLAKGNFILTRLFGAFALKVGASVKWVGRLTKGMLNLVGGIDLVLQGVIGLAVEGFKTLIGVGGDWARVQSTLALGFAKIGTAVATAIVEFIAAAPAIAAVVVVTAALAAAVGVLFFALLTVLAPFAALVNFALALPAALSVVLAIVLPLVIALHGMSDALGLIFEKDPKKFADGFKKLSPIMQRLVSAVRPVRGEFDKLVKSVQAAFLGPILTQLEPILKRILPQLSVSFTAVAGALGNIALAVLKVITSQGALDAISSAMGQVALFLDQNTGVITQLVTALGKAAVAALPIVLELLTKFGGFLGKFAEWIMGAITDGRFESWLNTGIEALKVIWGLVKALINLFTTLFGKLQTGGKDFLTTITNAINKFTTWVKSPEGSHALENMVKLAKLIAKAFEIALNFVIGMVGRISKIVDAINWINNHTGNPLGNLGKAAQWLSGYSGGGVVPQDQVAMVHKGEPILDPANPVARNRAILADAGMLDVLSGGTTVVNVFLGTERLDERVDYRIGMNNRSNAKALSTGPRSA